MMEVKIWLESECRIELDCVIQYCHELQCCSQWAAGLCAGTLLCPESLGHARLPSLLCPIQWMQLLLQGGKSSLWDAVREPKLLSSHLAGTLLPPEQDPWDEQVHAVWKGHCCFLLVQRWKYYNVFSGRSFKTASDLVMKGSLARVERVMMKYSEKSAAAQRRDKIWKN